MKEWWSKRTYFMRTNEKNKNVWRGTSEIHCLMRPCGPRPITLFTMLSPISFHFSCVYNVISADDLTRSLSFIGSAGKKQNDLWVSPRNWHSIFYSICVKPPTDCKSLVEESLAILQVYCKDAPIPLRPSTRKKTCFIFISSSLSKCDKLLLFSAAIISRLLEIHTVLVLLMLKQIAWA